MKILVCDDEKLARDRLVSMLDIFSNEQHIALEISHASDGLDCINQVNKNDPDLILLDIQMPGMNGIEVAQQLAQRSNPPAIIFTTAYQDYALDAFNHNTTAYLLKPVRKELLFKALLDSEKINKQQLNQLHQSSSLVNTARSHISTQLSGNIHLISIEDICYFRAENKYVLIKYLDGPSKSCREAISEETLKDLEAEFSDEFIRIHRNTLVRKNFIQSLKKNNDGGLLIKLFNCDDEIEVSRRHHSEVRKFLQS
ncbi:MAG: response regulator transcription factor [Gammaproteobacteria bacterium]|nr:response regulator transcription factor [Gammaproteobacteria bacterium]